MKLFPSLARIRVNRRLAAPSAPRGVRGAGRRALCPAALGAAAPAKRGLDSPPGRPAARASQTPRAAGDSGGSRAPGAAAWGGRSLHFPLVPPSPCQPGVRSRVCFPSKGTGTKVANESDEQTKEGEGPGTKLSVVLKG